MRIKVHQRNLKGAMTALLAASLLALAWSTSARGQGCPPGFVENFDGVTPPALPAGWTASQGVNVTGAPIWVTSTVMSHSWPNDVFSTAPINILDNRLDTPLLSASIFDPGITFQNNYNLESGRDGAVLEISSPNINGGAFTDITDPAVGGSVNPGYNSVISAAFQSPIAGRMAWSGNSGGYVFTQAFYGNAAFPLAHNVTVRFRMVSDNSGASEGWRIDTFSAPHNECSSPTPAPSACPLQPWTLAANYPLPVIEQNAMGTTDFLAYSAGGYTSPAETNAFYRYDPVANSWTALAPLPVALARARGVFSPTTNSFCVFGGLINQSTVLDTTYIYNVSTNTWSTGAPMPAPRYLPNVVYDAGKIFVIGGHTGSSEANQTWEYNPAANTWITGRANIPVAMGGSASGVFEHLIYLVSHLNGGAGSTLHYRYDITLNTWTLMPPAPATLYQPVGATIGRQICVVGGPNSAEGPSGPHTGSYVFDTLFNSWTTGPNTNIPHAYAGGTSLFGNRLLVVGGYAYGSADTNIVETAVTSCAATPPPTPTVTPSPTATPSPSATVPPTATPTPSDCPGGGCTPSPSATQFPTATPTPTPTSTPPPTPSPTATPSPTPAQALNISTRLRVETGDRIMIGGFIISGSAPKKVAIRGLGPSLGNSGLSDVLADPTLELRGSDSALLMQNDNWQENSAQAAQLIVLGLAPQNPNESGIVATLPPGAYTALMAGKNQTSGIGLVEVYDADAAAASQLANISTRGFVQTGDNVMIGGFILGHGSGSTDVAVRGRGPSLSQSGLNNVLADPTLELRDGNGALLIANDNWQDDPGSAAQLTARGFALPNPLESGIFATLSPGLFTAILAGKNGGVGIGLIEIFRVNPGNTLTVTSTADNGAGSLRQALTDANSGDTIQFAPALNGQAIALTSTELVIDKHITISGPGSSQLTVRRSTADGTPFFRILHVTPGHIVTIEGLTITGGVSQAASGGGVFNEQATLTVNNGDVSGNFSGVSGGGLYSSGASARLTIANSRVIGNFASGIAQGGGGQGGGIDSNGTLTIINSIVSGNSVTVQPPYPGAAGGIFSGGTADISNSSIGGNSGGAYGGGIVNGGGSMTITNSTISGNTTIGYGGGISSSGPLTITNCTITGNSASYKGFGSGGGISSGSAPLTITNSTLSGNLVGSFQGYGSSINLSGGTIHIGNTILNASGTVGSIFSNSGTVISHGYNLSSDSGGGFLTAAGDKINTDPMLGLLENNGGVTYTHKLLTGSPAINTGDPNFTPPPLYDQRGPGYPRVSGGRIDVGSFELQP